MDKQAILDLTRQGLDIFSHYLGFVPNKKNFKNPFYADSKASCHLFLDPKSGKYMFYDHGNSMYKGDCFWFVANKYNLNPRKDFRQILDQIIQDLNLYDPSSASPLRQPSGGKIEAEVLSIEEKDSQVKEYSFEEKDFSVEELIFWEESRITEEVLERFGVKSLQTWKSVSSSGNPYELRSTLEEPIYAYIQRDFVKLYRPKSELRFLYGGRKDPDYCFGLSQLPNNGDLLFITGGEKDVMSLSAHGFNAICFNSETVTIPKSIIKNLQTRFEDIVLLYDVDKTGRQESLRQQEQLSSYGVLRLVLPLDGSKQSKDITDYFRQGHKREDFMALVRDLFNTTYAQSLLMEESITIKAIHEPNEMKNIISINNVIVATQGDLVCITGAEGTGKSNFISALLSGAIQSSKPLGYETTLGVHVLPNIKEFSVLHFDTEQSELLVYKGLCRTLKRAGLSAEEEPSYFKTMYLLPLSYQQRLEQIKATLKLNYYRTGGIHFVVIDGVADLIKSANDEVESLRLVRELECLARSYNTCIVCILHKNPNGDKLRGHIGSEVHRKAASILSIEKDRQRKDLSVVRAIKVRGGNPIEVPKILFGWDKDLGMHVYRGVKSSKTYSRVLNDSESLDVEN